MVGVSDATLAGYNNSGRKTFYLREMLRDKKNISAITIDDGWNGNGAC